jgi:hypothetical protein
VLHTTETVVTFALLTVPPPLLTVHVFAGTLGCVRTVAL